MSENALRGMRVFISGPMTGIELYNVAEFFKAEARLKVLGASYVYNPAREWLDSKEERTHEEYMRRCISSMTAERLFTRDRNIDVMVRLNGWNRSDGAMLESQVARMCGIPILEQRELEAMEVD